MPAARQPTKTERIHHSHMIDLMRQVEWDLATQTRAGTQIPDDWHLIGNTRYPDRKVRITLRVEESVVKFFRAMGQGYQTRMNDVLASFVHARLARFVEGPEDIKPPRDEARPKLGETDAFIAKLKAYAAFVQAQIELVNLGTTEEEMAVVARMIEEEG